MSVTWISAWRRSPANVIVTMYQPAGRAEAVRSSRPQQLVSTCERGPWPAASRERAWYRSARRLYATLPRRDESIVALIADPRLRGDGPGSAMSSAALRNPRPGRNADRRSIPRTGIHPADRDERPNALWRGACGFELPVTSCWRTWPEPGREPWRTVNAYTVRLASAPAGRTRRRARALRNVPHAGAIREERTQSVRGHPR